MATTSVPEALMAQVRTGERFVLSSHVHPDGDALGSALGFARLLRGLGKGATVWSRDPVPRLYRPLYGSERIHSGDTPPAGFPDAYSHAIVLECPTLDRTGLEDQLRALPMLNIDHHLGNDQYGVVNWIDTTAPAVGAMVYRLARAMRLELDRQTATLLYLTLVTDTGGFRYANATAEAFEAAAELVRAGARPETVSGWLYESQPEPMVRLIGETLATLERHRDGRIATVWLTRDMLERAGAGDGDSEGLIDYPRSIDGVEAVALFRQLDQDRFKVSLRSRGDVDVEAIARRHGGGGHPNAAGFSYQGGRESLAAAIVEALAEALEAGTGSVGEEEAS